MTFQETVGIYPYPLAGYVGGDQPTTLQVYPLSESQWFKYVHFNNEDFKKIKDCLKEKEELDKHSIPEKNDIKRDELSKEKEPNSKKKIQ